MNIIERQITRQCIDDLLAAEFAISVFDGEEVTVDRSRDAEAIIATMGTTDEDYLWVFWPTREDGNVTYRDQRDGWVRFIYGNDAYVISDYTVNLEAALERTNALAEAYDSDTPPLFGPLQRAALADAIADADRYDDDELIGSSVTRQIVNLFVADHATSFDVAQFKKMAQLDDDET